MAPETPTGRMLLSVQTWRGRTVRAPVRLALLLHLAPLRAAGLWPPAGESRGSEPGRRSEGVLTNAAGVLVGASQGVTHCLGT